MSKRAHKRAVVARDQRRAAWDSMREKEGYKRPGSLNPRKGGRSRSGKR